MPDADSRLQLGIHHAGSHPASLGQPGAPRSCVATPAARAAAVIVAPRRSSAQNTSRTSSLCGPPTDGPAGVPRPSASGPPDLGQPAIPGAMRHPNRPRRRRHRAPARNSTQNSSGATNRSTTNTSTQVLHRFLEPEARRAAILGVRSSIASRALAVMVVLPD